MIAGAIVGGALGLALVVIGLLVALAKRGRAAGATIGRRKLEVRSAVPADAAFARVRELGGGYRTDDADPARGVVVLSSNPTFTTWGFLYPVFVHADGAGSRLEIGIQSRLLQYGPLVGMAHRRCAQAIEAALQVPAARVA
ncbi:MAG TPA: hypothetical protein VHE35_05355 [Kofleriaceae bacterium]|nr:hypothetical protein [Kofleriaceae bacterium]